MLAALAIVSGACSSTSTPSGGSGGSHGTGGVPSQGGTTGSGGTVQPGTGGASGGGGTTSAGGASSGGGTTGAGGTSSHPGTGGSSALGGTTSQPGTGGASAGGSTTGGTSGNGGRPGTGGSSALGGTTSQPGTGGATAVGGSSGRDAGPAAGGTGGGTAIDGGGSSPAGQSAGCGKTSAITSSQYNNGNPISITVGSMQRRYILHVPTGYDNTKPYKLVVAYHALDSNDHSVYTQNYYGMLTLSNNTTIFVAPNGQKNGAPCSGTGTGESGCGWPNTSDQDMQLADAVVKQVEDNFCVDTNRIFATGWSYGASMSEQTACERPLGGTQSAGWGVRAIAIYAVAYLSNSTNCKASKPVAYYATHGTCDSVLTYDGTSRCSTQTGVAGGVGVAKDWASVDGCTWTLPQKVTSGAHVCTKLSGCTAGYPLEFCSFNGDHTAYPDNGQETGSWGPQEAWTFLNQF